MQKELWEFVSTQNPFLGVYHTIRMIRNSILCKKNVTFQTTKLPQVV